MSGAGILVLLVVVLILNGRARRRLTGTGPTLADWIGRAVVVGFGAFLVLGALL